MTNLGPTFLLKDTDPATPVRVSPPRSKDITPFLRDRNRALEMMTFGLLEMTPVAGCGVGVREGRGVPVGLGVAVGVGVGVAVAVAAGAAGAAGAASGSGVGDGVGVGVGGGKGVLDGSGVGTGLAVGAALGVGEGVGVGVGVRVGERVDASAASAASAVSVGSAEPGGAGVGSTAQAARAMTAASHSSIVAGLIMCISMLLITFMAPFSPRGQSGVNGQALPVVASMATASAYFSAMRSGFPEIVAICL